MRRWPALVGAMLAILMPGLVIAQSGKHLNPTVGDVWTYFGPTLGSGWGVAGSGGGGSPPGGSSGMIQYNNAGALVGFLVTGDLSINTATGVATINPDAITTPKIIDGAVTASKLAGNAASANIGTLGGILTGTLPNPGLLASGITAGSYTCPTITFDVGGRATTAANGSCGGGSGSVTSVGLAVPASSIFGVSGSPITTSGTISLNTTGASGAVPYFSSASTLASSAVLPPNGFMVGGGTGAAPTATQLTGLVKGNGASAPTAAVIGSDYAAAPTGAANTPLFNNGTGGFTNGTRSGNTTTVGTTSGTLTSGNLTQFDANGNLVAGAGPGVTGSSLTSNRIIIGGGSSTVAALGSAGTTTTLLHGNAAGAPTFSTVSLTADVSGTLGGASGGTGINNGSSTMTLGGSVTLPAAPASTQCLHMSSAGAITATGSDCGSGVTQAATTTTVTAAQWANWQVFDIQAAAQTLTLPVVTSLSTNGGLLIKTQGNSVTITPNAADGINGLTVGTSVTVPANTVTAFTTSGISGTTALSAPLGDIAGTNVTITRNSNGTNTIAAAGGGSGAVSLVGTTQVASSSAALTFTSIGTSAYYQLRCNALLPATGGSSLVLEVSEDNGSTWKTSSYKQWEMYWTDTASSNGAFSTLSNSATAGVSNTNAGTVANISASNPSATSGAGVSLVMDTGNLGGTSAPKYFKIKSSAFDGTNFSALDGYGAYTGDNGAITAFRLRETSGNIASGQCSLYGYSS